MASDFTVFCPRCGQEALVIEWTQEWADNYPYPGKTLVAQDVTPLPCEECGFKMSDDAACDLADSEAEAMNDDCYYDCEGGGDGPDD